MAVLRRKLGGWVYDGAIEGSENDKKPSMLIRYWYQIGEIPKKQVTYQHARSKFDLGRLLCQVVLVDNFSQEALLPRWEARWLWPAVRP